VAELDCLPPADAAFGGHIRDLLQRGDLAISFVVRPDIEIGGTGTLLCK
jgi:hypothetical protein